MPLTCCASTRVKPRASSRAHSTVKCSTHEPAKLKHCHLDTVHPSQMAPEYWGCCSEMQARAPRAKMGTPFTRKKKDSSCTSRVKVSVRASRTSSIVRKPTLRTSVLLAGAVAAGGRVGDREGVQGLATVAHRPPQLVGVCPPRGPAQQQTARASSSQQSCKVPLVAAQHDRSTGRCQRGPAVTQPEFPGQDGTIGRPLSLTSHHTCRCKLLPR